MREILLFLIVTGCYPLARAWLANRRTSLSHAVAWAGLAWLGWLAAWWSALPQEDGHAMRYAALCLVCCPGIAVLGARRPTVAAWDLVVAGMLAVMLWPLLEAAIIGRAAPGKLSLVFPAGVLAVSIANYLPTRLGAPAMLAGAGCACEWLTLASPVDELIHWLAGVCVAAAPWLAFLTWPSRATTPSVDRLWLEFRDRYGLAWGQRVREQFNRAAGNAGWPVSLSWRGASVSQEMKIDEVTERAMLEAMRGLLRRFTETDAQPADR